MDKKDRGLGINDGRSRFLCLLEHRFSICHVMSTSGHRSRGPAQLLTSIKKSSAAADKFRANAEPKRLSVCAGFPGVSCGVEQEVSSFPSKAGLATYCDIPCVSILCTKNIIFIRNLPKGYQIYQYERPICNERLHRRSSKWKRQKRVRLTRISHGRRRGERIFHGTPTATRSLVDLKSRRGATLGNR